MADDKKEQFCEPKEDKALWSWCDEKRDKDKAIKYKDCDSEGCVEWWQHGEKVTHVVGPKSGSDAQNNQIWVGDQEDV